jgi:hypothetical protein
MRPVLLKGRTVLELVQDLLAFCLFTTVTIPVNLIAFSDAARKAKERGSL